MTTPNHSLSIDPDAVEKSAQDIIKESEPTTDTEHNSADEKFGAASEETNQESNRTLNNTREAAETLTDAARAATDEDTESSDRLTKIDPSNTTQFNPTKNTTDTTDTTTADANDPRNFAALLNQQQAQQQAAAQQQAQQEAAARNQAQYQQYVQQQQQLAQQQAQQQQLAYNQQQQALAMQRQQQSALMAQQQAQALANQGQNVQTITNSDGGYLISKDDLARIIDEAQNSQAGDVALGDSSAGDYRTQVGGEAPFTLGEPSDAGALDVGEVTYEKDPENATLSDEEMAGVINDALDANGISDDPEVREKWAGVMEYIGQNEANNVVNAANGWDSNAVGATQEDGFPAQSSRGIWQCIPGTFAANHVAGTSTSIYDPTASCAASVNYLINKYNCDPETGAGLDEFYNARYPTYKGY